MPKRVRSPASSTTSSASSRRSDSPSFPTLEGHDLVPREVKGDGACLFRAVSHGLYGDENRHLDLRLSAVKHMRLHPADFAPFCVQEHLGRRVRRDNRHKDDDNIEKVFDDHLLRMEQATEWGGEPEIQALAAYLNLEITIHRSDGAPSSTRWGGEEPWRQVNICYHVEGQHYWATDTKRQEWSPTAASCMEESGPVKKVRTSAGLRQNPAQVLERKSTSGNSNSIPALVDWSAKMGFAFDDAEE